MHRRKKNKVLHKEQWYSLTKSGNRHGLQRNCMRKNVKEHEVQENLES